MILVVYHSRTANVTVTMEQEFGRSLFSVVTRDGRPGATRQSFSRRSDARAAFDREVRFWQAGEVVSD